MKGNSERDVMPARAVGRIIYAYNALWVCRSYWRAPIFSENFCILSVCTQEKNWEA